MKGFVGILVLAFATLALAGNQCPSEQASDWSIELLLPHPDCDKFFKCTYGKPVEQGCPFGLEYNIENEQCDFPANVDCGDRNTQKDSNEVKVVDSSEEVAPEEEQPEEAAVESEESDEKPVVIGSAESSESDIEESSESESEGSGDEPAIVDSVEDSESESQEVQVIDFLPNGCPVSPHVHWLLPNRRNCNQFFSCVFGERVLRKCPATLHFNRSIQVCDFPENAGCARSINKHAEERRRMM